MCSSDLTYSSVSGCQTSILNLTIKSTSSGSSSASACDSYTWQGTVYTSSGAYTKTLTNAAGCDSTATLNLTITPSTQSAQSESACVSYTWGVNGQTYTQSGTYSSVSGCQTSILNLTIKSTSSGSSSASACDSYNWLGTVYTTSGV